jgi:hypothetical protein
VKTRWPQVGTILMFSSMLTSAGCSSTGKHVRWYDGPPRPKSEVVIVKVQRNPSPVLIQKIDELPFNKGKTFIRNNTTEIELLPGQHTFEVWYFDTAGRRANGNIVLNFSGELGHEYELHSAPVDEGFWHLVGQTTIGRKGHCPTWISDSQSKEFVAGTARNEDYKWYEK